MDDDDGPRGELTQQPRMIVEKPPEGLPCVLKGERDEMDPPRLAQGMAEKFINRVPFASEWSNRMGQFTGLPEHAVRLLQNERLLLTFPEGARGTAKLFPERYSLVNFGAGFMRLALQTRAPIIPVGFLGGGEAIPTIMNSYTIGKLIGAPYVPITPYLFAVPLPVELDIYYGEPMIFEGTGAEGDEVIADYVAQVKGRIAGLIERGREERKSGRHRQRKDQYQQHQQHEPSKEPDEGREQERR